MTKHKGIVIKEIPREIFMEGNTMIDCEQITTKELIKKLKEMHREIELEWDRDDKKQQEAVDEIIKRLEDYEILKKAHAMSNVANQALAKDLEAISQALLLIIKDLKDES